MTGAIDLHSHEAVLESCRSFGNCAAALSSPSSKQRPENSKFNADDNLFFIVSLSAQNFFFSFFLRSIREKLRLSEELSSRNDIISLLLRKFAPKRSFNDLFLFHCKTCCCFRRQRINNCYAPVFQSKVFYLWN